MSRGNEYWGTKYELRFITGLGMHREGVGAAATAVRRIALLREYIRQAFGRDWPIGVDVEMCVNYAERLLEEAERG